MKNSSLIIKLMLLVFCIVFLSSSASTKATVERSRAKGPWLSLLSLKKVSKLNTKWRADFGILVRNEPNVSSISRFSARVFCKGKEIEELEYEDKPFKPEYKESKAMPTDKEIDYFFSIHLPIRYLGKLTIKACASHGSERGCIQENFWIPRRPVFEFEGDLDLIGLNSAGSKGVFISNKWTLDIESYSSTSITVDVSDAKMSYKTDNGEVSFLPTWWKAYSKTESGHSKYNIVDTGWKKASPDFDQNYFTVNIPAMWKGKIIFQVKVKRTGYADRAGTYNGSLTVNLPPELSK